MEDTGNNGTMKLGTEPMGRLLMRMALPSVVAQLINLLYSIVDRIYIGHIPEVGPLALTGVGLFAPIESLSLAFASLVCTGGAPMMAMALGRGDREKALRYLGSSFSSVLVIGLAFTVILLVFAPELLVLFGASGNTLPFGLTYMRICALGTVFNMVGVGLNLFISSQGFSMTAMMSTVIGAILNIVLDPIFIYGFGMGVAGAAAATVISQAVSAVWILAFLMGRKCTVRLERRSMMPSWPVLSKCLALGSSSFIMFSTEGILSMTFTRSLFEYGADLAVGAMTILTSVNMFLMNVLHGLVQGGQPILSYNYGAGSRDRVKKGFSLIFVSCMSYAFLFWAAVMMFSRPIASIFTPDMELLEYTARAMKVFFPCAFMLGAQMACQHSFVALGQARKSMFLALLRKVILLIPMIIVLPFFFPGREVFAVFLSEPVCDTIAAVATTITFMFWFIPEMRKKDGLES